MVRRRKDKGMLGQLVLVEKSERVSGGAIESMNREVENRVLLVKLNLTPNKTSLLVLTLSPIKILHVWSCCPLPNTVPRATPSCMPLTYEPTLSVAHLSGSSYSSLC